MKSKELLFSFVFFAASITTAPAIALGQTQGAASVEGTVVQAGTSTPIPRTRVVLNTQDGRIISPPPPPGVTRVNVTLTTSTDDQGRFSFSNVPPGNYQMVATHDGYVTTTFGDIPQPDGRKRFQLAPGQNLKNIAMTMTPTSTITGRIKNTYGEPVGNVTVQAHRFIFEGGRRELNSVLTVLTNDLGEYRLYYLEPGQYMVMATPAEAPTAGRNGEIYVGNFSMLPGSPLAGTKNTNGTTSAGALAALGVVGAADTGETYLPFFYPGTTDPSASTPIELRPGTSFENADFTISGVRAVRVRGQIVNSTGQPARGAHVTLMSQVTGYNYGLNEQSGTVSENGSFEFRGIAPGNYDLVATMGNLPSDIAFPGSGYPGGAILETYRIPIPPDTRPPAPRLVAKTSIQVGSVDVSNIALSLGPGYRISGKITVDGHSGPESDAMTSGITIQLVPDPETFESAAMPATVGPNGTFTITGAVPGSYQIAIMGADNVPPDSYVKSILLDNMDAINPRLLITNEPRGQLEIVLGTNPGFVTASVVDAKQSPAVRALVVLIPDAPRRQHFEQYLDSAANSSGVAEIGDIIPGDYTAYAWEDIEYGSWWDPVFISKYESLGKRIHINGGAMEKLTLTLIPSK